MRVQVLDQSLGSDIVHGFSDCGVALCGVFICNGRHPSQVSSYSGYEASAGHTAVAWMRVVVVGRSRAGPGPWQGVTLRRLCVEAQLRDWAGQGWVAVHRLSWGG